MISKSVEKLKRELEEFFSTENKSVEEAERYFAERLSETVTGLLAAYYEVLDRKLLADKAGRKAAGMTVERLREPRQILTRLGMVEYKRTYYAEKDGTYSHPVDVVAGVERYQRVSGGVSLGLVEAACEMSYAKSSRVVTGGQVSRQTVLHKIRKAQVKEETRVERRHVPVIHIDADEEHVKLQNGKSRIVPLISVYEGIERAGKRGVCKNVFHRSRYGEKPEKLWEETLAEVERRYDLEGTKIYLHGDGAPWIRAGQEWFPNSEFVLDRYHKNKALKGVVSGIERKVGCQYEALLRKALNEGDKDFFFSVRDSLLLRWPERKKQILEKTQYLLDHFEAIQICQKDPEAIRGGATEPHVSHVLSARLSSRPMAWSEETLRHFVPILAAGRCTLEPQTQRIPEVLAKHIEKDPVRSKRVPFALGLPDPDHAVSLPARAGRVTPLFTVLRPFFR